MGFVRLKSWLGVGPERLSRLRLACCALLMATVLAAPGLMAGPGSLPFSGRLVDAAGQPLSGAVDLTVEFYASQAGNDVLSRAPIVLRQVALSAGVFTIAIPIGDEEFAALFSSGAAVYLQVHDHTNQRTYRRQRYQLPAGIARTGEAERGSDVTVPTVLAGAATAVTTAPVAPGAAPALDAATATSVPEGTWASTTAPVPEAVAPAASEPQGSAPRLSSLRAAAAAACLASPVAGAKFTLQLRDASQSCAAACAQARVQATCLRGWTVYAGDAYFDYGNECTVAPGPSASEQVVSRICCCLSTTGPAPLAE